MLTEVLHQGQELTQYMLSIMLKRLTAQVSTEVVVKDVIFFNPSCIQREFRFARANSSAHADTSELQQLAPYSFAITVSDPSNEILERDSSVDNDLFLSRKPISYRGHDSYIYILESSAIKVTISESGEIISLIDKRVFPLKELIIQNVDDQSSKTHEQREPRNHAINSVEESEYRHYENLLSNTYVGNNLMLYDDIPLYWAAWDVFPYHIHTGQSTNKDRKVHNVGIVINETVLNDKDAIDSFFESTQGQNTSKNIWKAGISIKLNDFSFVRSSTDEILVDPIRKQVYRIASSL